MDRMSPPVWVRKRAGHLEPFEADKISRSLFAVGEALGSADAFLARELADGVVHFLSEENEEGIPTTGEVATVVIKVVRELGQPALAAAYARGRERIARRSPEPRSVLSLGAPAPRPLASDPESPELFTRDLLSARRDGLLSFAGVDPPDRLEAAVVRGGVDAVAPTARVVGRSLVLDGGDATRVEELKASLRGADVATVVNIYPSYPPAWAVPASGTLFPTEEEAINRLFLSCDPDFFTRELGTVPSLRIDCHLSPKDFVAGSEDRARLERVVGLALKAEGTIGFVLDRPRQPVALAEGLHRGQAGVLMTVGLHLPRLGQLPGMRGDPERFLRRLASLARLALSAGVQRRRFLRDRQRAVDTDPGLTSGFLLDRAHLAIVPVGLAALVPAFTGEALRDGGPGLAFACRVLRRLQEILVTEGRSAQLDVSLDGPFSFAFGEGPPGTEEVAGLTGWDPAAPLLEQLRVAGSLHAVAGHGTAGLFLPREPDPTPGDVAGWLELAWRQTRVVRVRVMRTGSRE